MSIAQQIHDRLKAAGLNEFAIAGILGNLEKESGLLPNNLQNTFNAKFGLTDAQYTERVDSGRYKNFAKDKAGYGLAQWTYWTRKQALLDFATSRHVSIGDASMQADFLAHELQTSYVSLFALLKSATSVEQASNAFLTQFERPANMEAKKKERYECSMKYYKLFNGNTPAVSIPVLKPSTGSKTSYLVKVSIPNLRIRSGHGTGYLATGYIKPGVYTIVEEAPGAGASMWGKLKSGSGWISLDHVKRL